MIAQTLHGQYVFDPKEHIILRNNVVSDLDKYIIAEENGQEIVALESQSGRKIFCPYCSAAISKIQYEDYPQLADHVRQYHSKGIPSDILKNTGRLIYYIRTGGRTHGSCVICGHDTKWNEKTQKYHRFCDNPACKEKYRAIFRKRMIGKYGKVTLLNDPEQQRAMLAKRKISGVYRWTDHIHESIYTGSYELAFLKFLDENMQYNPTDVLSPSPHNYYYELDGKKHLYIPDFYIGSLNLEVEIKDEDNMHPNRIGRDAAKERKKDDLFRSMESRDCAFPVNYIKIVGKNHMKFLQYLSYAKFQYNIGKTTGIAFI